ncbi:MAG: outer membrane protein assembly factor BamA [Acetobacteraceae bacterium]|nr:outer membrane protein assembly factor BamA [Acetobacteraceae bacterium]
MSLLAVGLPGGGAYSQTVDTIVVQGNRRVEAATIRSYFKPGPGGRLDAQSIDDGYKALFATGLFEDVRISQSGGHLVVTVVENPVIDRIAFEGNRKIKDEQLKGEIQSKERGTLSRPLVQSDVQRLVEVYRRGGRFDVHIEPKIIELPNNRVDLVFEITEGQKTDVKTIRFVGNRAYSSSRLKDEIKTVETKPLLGFLQTTNIYDPDRLEADRELLRRFYLKHGFIDVRIISAVGEYDPAAGGFVITFTIDEGEQYRVGRVDVQSTISNLNPGLVRPQLRLSEGDVYNAEAVEKSVEEMTVEAARQGFAFATVRPGADRQAQTRTVNLSFTVAEGQRAYIERINIRGNTKTRDYVIRREFDLAEGDAYNRALIARAERRLKNLNFFKTVKISTEPGSAPDRVIVDVDVEDQSTGEISLSGGYSTSDGALAEASIGERNLFGLGLAGRASVTYGQFAKGAQLSFVEPYLFGYRLAAGIDLFAKQQLPTNFISYQTDTVGANLRLGFALREDLSLQLRYSAYRQQIVLPQFFHDCNNINPDFTNTFPTPSADGTSPATTFPGLNGTGTINQNCYANGEVSLPIKVELLNGAVVTSLVGYTLAYNTVDDNRNPTSGIAASLSQDLAGAGGDVRFLRESGDFKKYWEVVPDVVGLLHVQGGTITGWGNSSTDFGELGATGVRMLDNFQMGPNLVRGFAPAGIGPRDITPGTTNDAIGGTNFWGASIEVQSPLFGLPKDIGLKAAAYVDAGSLWDYRGPLSLPETAETMTASPNNMFVNSSAGVGLLWASPFGPIRFDLAYPITKRSFDRTQIFRFSGGTSF